MSSVKFFMRCCVTKVMTVQGKTKIETITWADACRLPKNCYRDIMGKCSKQAD
jgi:hypothetical protein